MPGRYLIVSGHRRRAAYWLLYEENPEKWEKAPCIVEPAAASPELQELRLIYANADTRKMSSADLSAQAERVEMLLYKLKDQGMEFPGRMRDHVAEACKVSATKLAELKVIREKLIPELRQLWESGKLNHTVAYRLAQAEEHAQTRLTELYTAPQIEAMPEWRITDKINALHGLSLFCCPDGSGPCSNVRAREERDLLRNDNCNAHCCMDCYWLCDCDDCCNKAEAKKQQLVEEFAAVREQAAEKREAEEQAIITDGKKEWERIAVAARAAGISSRALAALLEGDTQEDVEDETVAEVDQRMKGTFRLPRGVKPWQTKTYNNPMDACDEPQILIDLADLLKCSTDYLLGRTEELTPSAAPPQQTEAAPLRSRSGTPEWISTNDALPKQGCEVLILDEDGDVDLDRIDRDGRWFFSSRTPPKWWAPIPPAPGEDPEPYYAEPVINPEPRWQQGDPLRPGRYLCLVDMGKYDIHEQRCDWTGSEWRVYDSTLDSLFTVKAWYPLPDKNDFREVVDLKEEEEDVDD